MESFVPNVYTNVCVFVCVYVRALNFPPLISGGNCSKFSDSKF